MRRLESLRVTTKEEAEICKRIEEVFRYHRNVKNLTIDALRGIMRIIECEENTKEAKG